MAITPISVPNTDQGPTSAPLVLSCSTSVSNLAIWATFPFSPDPQQVELIWGGGAFAPRYAASTQVAGLFTIKRVGGWASKVVLSFQEGSAPSAALQSLDANTVAAWTFLYNGTAISVADRSGNSHTMTTPSNFVAASLIPGSPAMCCAAQAAQGAPGGGVQVTGTAIPVNLGAMSLVCMVQCSPYRNAVDNWLYAKGTYGIGDAGNTTFSALFGNASGANPLYYIRGASTDTVVSFDGIAYPTDGLWHAFALVRQADGVTLTAYLDGTSQTKVAARAPDNGASGADTAGTHVGDNTTFQGSFYDMMIFNRALSGAEVAARFAVMNP